MSVAAGPDPSAPPQSRTNGPVPWQNRSPERRRGRPKTFALPTPLRKTGPPAVPATHCQRSLHTRRLPPPTPKLQTRNPTPAPLWTSALLQGDRNPLESVIVLPERVIGIVGMRRRMVGGDCETFHMVEEVPGGPPCRALRETRRGGRRRASRPRAFLSVTRPPGTAGRPPLGLVETPEGRLSGGAMGKNLLSLSLTLEPGPSIVVLRV